MVLVEEKSGDSYSHCHWSSYWIHHLGIMNACTNVHVHPLQFFLRFLSLDQRGGLTGGLNVLRDGIRYITVICNCNCNFKAIDFYVHFYPYLQEMFVKGWSLPLPVRLQSDAVYTSPVQHCVYIAVLPMINVFIWKQSLKTFWALINVNKIALKLICRLKLSISATFIFF